MDGFAVGPPCRERRAPSRSGAVMSPSLKTALLNLTLYQLGWWGCVLGGAQGYPLSGAGLGLVLAGMHLALVPRPATEVRLMLLAGVMGGVGDTLLTSAGLLSFTSGVLWPGFTTPWMLVLWIQFASLLRWSLGWLSGRPVLAAALGCAGGPAAYLAGEALGAIAFPAGTVVGLAGVSLLWLMAMPVLSIIASASGVGRSAAYRGMR